VLASRSLGTYVGVLAAGWRGTAYVPLNPKLPDERLAKNPIGLVEIRGVSKRRKKPFILTAEQYHEVVEQLDEPYRQWWRSMP